MLSAQLKKGSADALVLSILEHEPHHGYEIAKLIGVRSSGQLLFHASSLYPILYKLAARGLISGKWVERPGERRRKYYQLTAKGSTALTAARDTWNKFAVAMTQVLGWNHG